MDSTCLTFWYRNWEGKVSVRRVRPTGLLKFASTAWHPEPQWLMECWDLDKQATRDYALSGILSPPLGRDEWDRLVATGALDKPPEIAP